MLKHASTHYQLKPLTPADLSGVARIHEKAFPESLLTLFGIDTIIKYYDWQMIPPNVCEAFGGFEGNDLFGFCFAGAFRNAEIYFIKENLVYFLGYVLGHPSLWLKKILWARFANTLSSFFKHFLKGNWKRSKGEQVKKDRFGILSIAVDPGAQGSGIGKMLMTEVERIAIELGHRQIRLNVHPENQNAVIFYEKMGWEKVNYEPELPWQGYMEKQL